MKKLVFGWVILTALGLANVSCSRTNTVFTSGYSAVAFEEVVPEMKSKRVVELLGEPFSRNYAYYSGGAANTLVHREDWTPSEPGRPSVPQIWRYSKQGKPGTAWQIRQVMIDPNAGRVMTKDSYLSPPGEMF